jgi:hypothetical protein
MNTSILFLSRIERYINSNFPDLVNNTEGLDNYIKLMDIRGRLQDEVNQIQKSQSIRNNPHVRMVRNREECIRRKSMKERSGWCI